MSVFPFAIFGRALFVLTRVAMTYFVKLDAIIRDVPFPRTAVRTLGEAVVLVHTNVKLALPEDGQCLLRQSGRCFAG